MGVKLCSVETRNEAGGKEEKRERVLCKVFKMWIARSVLHFCIGVSVFCMIYLGDLRGFLSIAGC